MKKIKSILKDIYKVLKIGSIISLVIVILCTIYSISVHGCFLINILTSISKGLFIIGSIFMFISAGFLIKKDSSRELKNKLEWQEKFKVLNFVNVILCLSIVIIFYGIIVDKILHIVV